MESTQTEDAKANTNGNANATREKLMGEMQNVIHEAEGWLRTSTHATGEEFRSARAKFEAALSRAKADVIEFEENVVEKAKQAAHATDDTES